MLHLTTGAFDQMASWARERLPEEACGLLAGRRREDGAWVERVFCLENEDPDWPSIVAYAQDEKRTVRRLMVTHDA
jgi:proteasome lid subunit RPN8/RPN11